LRWFFLVFLFYSQITNAESLGSGALKKAAPSLSQQITADLAPLSTKWSLQWSSFFLNYRGERPATSLLYDFGQISTFMNLLSINYQLNPRWSAQLLLQHFDTSFEAFFPLAPPQWQKSKNRLLGVGDTSINANYLVQATATTLWTAHLGLSMPTGSIDMKNTLPGLTQINLGYNAQLGSGTNDLMVGGSGIFLQPSYSIGSRFLTTVHTGLNNNGYRLGNIYRLDSWLDYKLGAGFTSRLTGQYRHRDGLTGFDRTRGKTPADNFFFEDQINWDISTALQYKHLWPLWRLAIIAEFGVPLLQDNINADNSFVASVYYASVSLNTTF
jgi:hypothetical protein